MSVEDAPRHAGLTLETARLLLRPLAPPDAPVLFTIYSDAEVMRYWSTPPTTDPAHADDRIARSAEGWRSGSHFTFGLERRQDAQLLGVCTVYNISAQNRRADIGYVLARLHWGQGYMHEALHAMVAHAFGALQLLRLEADIDPRNRASARALERLGFVQEGLLRERWIVNGEVSDTAFYGLLAREWVGASVRLDDK